jgi:hypothetical protein
VTAKDILFREIGYTANETQAEIHQSPARVRLVAGGERSGKSYTGAAELVGSHIPGSLFWIVGPDYEQARPEFMYAHEMLSKIGAVASVSMPRQGQCAMTLKTGVEIVTKTGEDVMKLASKAPDGIVMTEAAQQSYENFIKLFGRTAEKRAWLYVSGTFETSLGWYAEMFTTMQGPNIWGGRSFSLPTWSNTAIFPGGRDDPEIKRLESAYPADLFQERFGGVPTPPRGLVFREFKHTVHVAPMRFGKVEAPVRDESGWILPDKSELELWIDPGYAGAYAVLFVAVIGSMVFHVDEVYAQGKVGEQVITETLAKRDLFERVKRGTIDIAGRAHNAMESQVELWQRLANLNLSSEMVPIADGIARHRTFLSDPRTMAPRIHHDPRCVGTIAEYGKYKYAETNENRPENELPVDRDNHSMKAIAYGLYHRFGYVERLRKAEPRSLIADRGAPELPAINDGARRAWLRAKGLRAAEARDLNP